MALRYTGRVFLPIPLALALLLSVVQPASAVLGDRHATTGDYSATVTSPFWTGQAHYGADWHEAQIQDAGQTWWLVSKIHPYLYVHLGDDCLTVGGDNAVCSGFTLYAKVEFLSNSGNVLKTITNFGGGNCGWSGARPPQDWVEHRCSSGPHQVNISANRIRFTWQGTVFNRNGHSASWQQITRTYYL